MPLPANGPAEETKTTPEFGAFVNVAPSNPANETAWATPAATSGFRCLRTTLVGPLQARARRQEIAAMK
jgi:hypothetical protein